MTEKQQELIQAQQQEMIDQFYNKQLNTNNGEWK